MSVVATGMADARNGRYVRRIVVFLNRQRVHIGANSDDGRAFTDITDDAGFGDAGLHFDSHAAERVGDETAGTELLKSQFRVAVNIAPPGDNIVLQSLRAPKQR